MAAAAIALSLVDAAIPTPLPGVKPGLANIVTLVALRRYGWRVAAWVNLLRVTASSLLLGQLFAPGFFLSLSGAIFSLAALSFTRFLSARWFGLVSWSLIASAAHIAGQLFLARLWLVPHDGLFRLIPVFALAALISGLVNGLIAARLMDSFADAAPRAAKRNSTLPPEGWRGPEKHKKDTMARARILKTTMPVSHAAILRVARGDIAALDVDAIVNAANETLLGGGGVDGAIHRAAGRELLAFCRKLGGCRTGEAKITPGFALPARAIVHTVGPVWQDGRHNEAELLADCYRNSLTLAAQSDIRSIAFPAISTGAYGYPPDEAASIALRSVRETLRDMEQNGNSTIREVTFCCFSAEDEARYRALLEHTK
jgi:O-acetyl-ADP-ribose deacetylase (regulator of RNase III)/uncharacterized membrane protein